MVWQAVMRNVGGATEQQGAPAMVQHLPASMGSQQGLISMATTAAAAPQPLGQTPQYPQHPQAMQAPHMLQVLLQTPSAVPCR